MSIIPELPVPVAVVILTNPPPASAKLKLPEPSVFKNWSALPSLFGNTSE